jgi:hypothetical protein
MSPRPMRRQPMSRRVLRLRAALARLDDHWLGDLIGGLSLAGTGWLLFVAAGLLS